MEKDHKPTQMKTPKIEENRRVFKRSFRYGIGIGTKIEAKRVRKMRNSRISPEH